MSIARIRSAALPRLCADYLAAVAARKAAEKAEALAKAGIVKQLAGRSVAACAGYLVKLVAVAGTPARPITAAMVGETIPGRRGHDRLDVTPLEAANVNTAVDETAAA